MEILPTTVQYVTEPISPRDYFAGLAMQSLMAQTNPDYRDDDGLAKCAFKIADAMMNQRAKGYSPLLQMQRPDTSHCSVCGSTMINTWHCVNTDCPANTDNAAMPHPIVEEPDVRPECSHCHHAMNYDIVSNEWKCFNPLCPDKRYE